MTDTPKPIDTITAWICTEPDGGEGILGFRTDDGWLPMIGGNARVEALRPLAMQLAAAEGLPLRLVRFSAREVIEEHLPEPENPNLPL